MMFPPDSPARLLWAKTDKENRQPYPLHPLICHLVDVAQVVRALWDHSFTAATRRYFADTMGLDEDPARQWLAFLAGAHDLGKASPTFQEQYTPARTRLEGAGFAFPHSEKADHGLVSTWALKRLLPEQFGLAGEAARNLAVAVGGHHGAWYTALELELIELDPRQRGEGAWEDARASLLAALADMLEIPSLPQPRLPADEEAANTFYVLLAGLTSFADWIGSMDGFFGFAPTDVDLGVYSQRAYQQAAHALEQLGWIGWSPPPGAIPFLQLFPSIESPRPLQETVISLAEQLPAPALVIIEAPTGEGKTEAAWYLADHWLWANQQRGAYVAMPTRATSNQMFGRVRHFIECRYPDSRTNLLLLHGDAAWSEEMRELRMAAVADEEEGAVIAQEWFLPKKRGLLAPFAVGTVDQALLAVLQTRHFFVRMFGLSHKTVIFDEIHAYDTYINVLLQRLLRWLAAMNTSVILLSATLPARTRRQLVEAYTGRLFEQEVSYPAIAWAAAGAQGVLPLKAAAPRTVSLEWLDNTTDSLVTELCRSLREGGCAAVLCNTVARAQEAYKTLGEAGLVPEEDLILFHARFPFYRREEIERQVLDRFGKDGQRPQRSIVIATQVIEQSLDLDFDLMISDLAPVDLLLQRAGRLHRHQRHNPRSAPLGKPRLLIVQPKLEGEVPQFGDDRFVYAPYVLLRSYLALHERGKIAVPADVQPLIEAVYGDDETVHGQLSPAWQQALNRERKRLDAEMSKQKFVAKKNLVYPPGDEDVLRQSNRRLEEDNPELHETFQALTRMGRPGITLVCLHQTPNGIALDPDGEKLVDLETAPDRDTTRELAHRSVSISNYPVVQHFAGKEPPAGWKKHSMLRYCRPAIFVEGRCEPGGDLRLTLDSELGIVIERGVERSEDEC
jgi:CRISPR-associated endonuclease/helicase Cas3